MENNYDKTISDSKTDSILKALQLLEAEEKSKERTVIRPDIKTGKIIAKHVLRLICFLLFSFLLFYAARALEWRILYPILITVAAAILITVICIKKSCIEFVRLYQKLAPERIRKACVFEPSCSEYMILAIEKYGLIKGVFKGIKRLSRCHYPNGGIDYP